MVTGKKAAIGDSCEEVQGIYWKAGGIGGCEQSGSLSLKTVQCGH